MDGFDSFFYESRLATGPTVLQTFDYARKDVDPKSVGLSMPYAVGYSAALNSSGGKERIRGAGWVLVDPETSFHWSSKNGESFYGDYVFTQRASDVERLLDEERVVTPGALPTYHPFRNLSVRPVKGDSGGPLYALDSLGRETLIGVAKTAFPPDNFKADSGAGDATWVDISAYAQPLAAMKQALESTPLPGTSPRTGLLPIRWQFFWDSKDVLNFYSVSPLLSLGRFYLDPPAGEFEELSVSTPGVTFAAMLLPNVDAAITAGTLKIEYFHDGHGQFVDSTWTRESDQWIVFGEKYSKLRVSGLGVPVGTMLTFGIELNDPSFEGTSIEWRNVGALAAVPEASTTGLILVGLLSMAARRSILRKA